MVNLIVLLEGSHGALYVSFGMNPISPGYVHEISMRPCMAMNRSAATIDRSVVWRDSGKQWITVVSGIWASLTYPTLGTIVEKEWLISKFGLIEPL
jgi:hypothetical protein